MRQLLFPSPPETSYFLIAKYDAIRIAKQFPSPPGTSYFLIGAIFMPKIKEEVSVPSGDFLFSNKPERFGEHELSRFRPLWGLLIF